MDGPETHAGCSMEFAELCALATSGALKPEEWQQLVQHVKRCPDCAALLGEYQGLVNQGISKLAAKRSAETAAPELLEWDRADARLRFLAQLQQSSQVVPQQREGSPRQYRFFWSSLSTGLSFAVILLVGIAVSYHLGNRSSARRTETAEQAAALRQLSLVREERSTLSGEVSAAEAKIKLLEQRAAQLEKNVKDAEALRAQDDTKMRQFAAVNGQQSSSIASLSTEKRSLEQRLQASEAALQDVRQELNSTRDERQQVLLRASNLETLVDHLSAQLHDRDQRAQREEQYLASDRDIRELMGARQLYIADVFDIDALGKTKKPFGRVFYTRGKSLIFYAFDLDKQTNYREAKAFQAWGRPSASQAKPVSLGIFYLDSEANRRWALKVNDPKVLEEISSVFVTVEPKGGSKKPTNRPFLLAYLHTAPPNHP